MATSRIAVIDRDLCIKEKCYQCIKVCPVNRMGQECIVVDKESGFPVISEVLCIGCGICAKKCPASCITIINLAKELEHPIYQYGVNAFRLYGLPIPKKGTVSLIGKNGIGKTTTIKLLSKHLMPNFAIFDKKLSEKEILEKLPMETRRYFQQVGKELKISQKPQYVDKLRDVFKGTVEELLEETAGKKKNEIIDLFGMKEILKRKISQLSGGELQKVSMAVAYLQDADIYYFDEFTNYLDIGERLRAAVILKDLGEEKRVVIAEHDLTMLDYVSNYVHVFYGEENTYGVVSGVKNVRAGINEYIQGFLKEENVRFRETEISFSTRSETELKAATRFIYPELKKKFKGFEFKSEAGEIRKGEIVGLVGKNALGKSLLIKMFAGAEKPDEGELVGFEDVKVSYKPQYISAEDVVVREMLEKQNLDSTVFEECKRRLKIHTLMEKKLTELSGGELQRIAITLALSRNADFYLFDEPSAFLDIEQRFQFAELLRKVITESEKSAFVVDHDIVFIDSIANRLITFNGKSSVEGHASKPMNKKDGMNAFLEEVGITMRRDKDTKRPRINKPGSNLDEQQKKSGEYYYTSK